MKSIHIPDIGHGLAGQIFHYPRSPGLIPPVQPTSMALIDCGKMNGPRIAHRAGLKKHNPDIFILSHFHSDHYNGLQVAESDSQTLNKVYYPRIPDFPNREKYILYNIAIAERVYGHRTGSVTADLLSNIQRINRQNFHFIELHQGQTFSIGDQSYEVLWPPRELDDPAQELLNALQTFEDALGQDETLQKITEQLQKREIITYYRENRRFEAISEEQGKREVQWTLNDRELPEITQRAQKELRDATDRMSLAFHNSDRLLFLGDLKAGELRKVSDQLKNMRSTLYDILISPHHGTRYSPAMAELEANWTISSLGEENLSSIETKIRDIGRRNWATYLDGHFTRPIYSASTIYDGYPGEVRWPFPRDSLWP